MAVRALFNSHRCRTIRLNWTDCQTLTRLVWRRHINGTGIVLSHCGRLHPEDADKITSQNSSKWEESHGQLHLDTSHSTLVIRPQTAGASAGQQAPLAPKQGLGGSLANARGQHSSPISGTYALRTPRGKITSIACESCRKRKSKVRDGLI